MAISLSALCTCLLLCFVVMSVTIGGDMCTVKRKGSSTSEPVEQVRDASCFVYNWKEMTCTWELSVVFNGRDSMSNGSIENGPTSIMDSAAENFNHVDYVIILEWTVFQMYSLCPNRKIEGHCLTCIFNENDGKDGYRMLEEYYFSLNVTNTKRGISKQSSWSFQTEKLVQPASVSNLAVFPNRTKMDVFWNHSENYHPQVYRIQYRSPQDSKWKEMFLNHSESKRDNHTSHISELLELFMAPVDWKRKSRKCCNFTLTGLKPFTNYTIKVQSIPLVNRKREGFWSEAKIIVTKTLEDVPSAVPQFLPGFFYCKVDNCSRIHILWKPIKDKNMNGDITSYRIRITHGEIEEREENIFIPVSRNSILASHELTLNSDLVNIIKLTQRTKAGYPNQRDAAIVLPPVSDRPNLPQEVLVEADSPTHVTISWILDTHSHENLESENVTVVICKKSPNNTCQRIIYTRMHTAITNNTEVWLPEGSYTDYLFGVSVEAFSEKYGGPISSGIKWNECTYQKNGVSSKSPIVQLIMDHMYQNSMKIAWTKYDCDESVGLVRNYILYYCVATSVNCTESDSVHIDRDKKDYTIKNLSPTKYRVWVTANFSGGTGPRSEVLFFHIYNQEPEADDNSFPIWLIAICIILLFMTIAIVLIFYMKWYCHNVDKKLKIDVPKGLQNCPQSKQDHNSQSLSYSPQSSGSSETSPFIKLKIDVTTNENTVLMIEESDKGEITDDNERDQEVSLEISHKMEATNTFHDAENERTSSAQKTKKNCSSFDMTEGTNKYDHDLSIKFNLKAQALQKKNDCKQEKTDTFVIETAVLHGSSGQSVCSGSIDEYLGVDYTGSSGNLQKLASNDGDQLEESFSSSEEYLKAYPTCIHQSSDIYNFDTSMS